MENAHLRLGLLEYVRITEKASTRIRLRVDRYMGEGRQSHLLSVFGNDSDGGAITAAVHEKAAFSLTFPDGTTKDVTLGEHASCYKGAVTLPGRKHPVRHLLAVSEELHMNGTAGRTLLLRYRREEAWATLVSFLGLPADPAGVTMFSELLSDGSESKRSTESAASRCWFQRPRKRCSSGSARGCGQELWPSRARRARSRGRAGPLWTC
jgi:hypothetical protein